MTTAELLRIFFAILLLVAGVMISRFSYHQESKQDIYHKMIAKYGSYIGFLCFIDAALCAYIQDVRISLGIGCVVLAVGLLIVLGKLHKEKNK